METVLSIRQSAKRDVSERRRAIRGARDARRRARGRCQHSARPRALFRWRRCLARRSPWRPASPAERRLDRQLASEVSRPSDGPRRRRPGVPGASTAWLARRHPPRTRRTRSTTSPTLTPSRCARFLPRSRPPSGGHPHPRPRPRRNVVTFADRSPREPLTSSAARFPVASRARRNRHAGRSRFGQARDAGVLERRPARVLGP